jgi:hypothetical protein
LSPLYIGETGMGIESREPRVENRADTSRSVLAVRFKKLDETKVVPPSDQTRAVIVVLEAIAISQEMPYLLLAVTRAFLSSDGQR